MPDNGNPSIKRVTQTDFAQEDSQIVSLAAGFDLRLWAPGPLLASPVSISFDGKGYAYVSETQRRKSSDLDIRQHRDWMQTDLSLQSLADRESFYRRTLSAERSEENTWLVDFNGDSIRDWRDLMVESERIRRVWDSDGDGRADASNLFATGFQGMSTGVAAGVLHTGNEVFLTVVPHLWRMQDQDGDGDADTRRAISEGFGVHIAYAGHDMSGLVRGPDGKVYWSIGDLGLQVQGPDGQVWAYPHEGAVMRANPDGSEFEVFAHGLRNPQELAFDAYGNLISVDNDGDHPGEHERFVHILEGSDSGWRIYWQFGKYKQPHGAYKVWMDERLHVPHFPGQAAYILPPLALAHDGPAGLAYQPGTALGPQWDNYFFASYFTGSSAQSRLHAFRLAPKGASFSIADDPKILQGLQGTGLSFAPDGALYIADWLEGYAKKTEGRIWRLDVAEGAHPLRAETQRLLAEGIHNRAPEALAELLAHPDMRIRLEAQFALAEKNAPNLLLAAIEQRRSRMARLHGIWGLGQLARRGAFDVSALTEWLRDEDAEIRAQTAKVLGETEHVPALISLVTLLNDTSARVQLYAAEALGKIGNKQAFDPLVGLLAEVGESDPHLRHALCLALARLGDIAALAQLAQHPSVEVRVGAVVALRHLRAPALADFLADREERVLVEAARAIHDDASVPAALPQLAAALAQNDLLAEAWIRRVLNANLRVGGSVCARRLAQYASEASHPLFWRAEALWALGSWPEPSPLDWVEGRYRDLAKGDPAEVHEAMAGQWEILLAARQPELRAATAELAGRVAYQPLTPRLYAGLKNKREAVAVRVACLEALGALNYANMEDALTLALESSLAPLRQSGQQLIGELDLSVAMRVEMLAKVLTHGEVRECQLALASLAKLEHPEAANLLQHWMDQLAAGKVNPALQLDVLQAARNSSFAELQKQVARYQAAKDPHDPLAHYRETLYGGDAEKGARLLYTHPTAQCLRCHQIQGLGGVVGPDLTEIGAILDREAMLAALVVPSQRIAPGYGSVSYTLKDGQSQTKVYLGETPQGLWVKGPDGQRQQVPWEQIERHQMLPSSMPQMDAFLNPTEMRDILAYLISSQ